MIKSHSDFVGIDILNKINLKILKSNNNCGRNIISKNVKKLKTEINSISKFLKNARAKMFLNSFLHISTTFKNNRTANNIATLKIKRSP